MVKSPRFSLRGRGFTFSPLIITVTSGTILRSGNVLRFGIGKALLLTNALHLITVS